MLAGLRARRDESDGSSLIPMPRVASERPICVKDTERGRVLLAPTEQVFFQN